MEEFWGGEGWKFVESATHCHGPQCGFLCGVFVVLFGGARMPAWMQQGDVSIISTEPT